jgi:hypothetical protein
LSILYVSDTTIKLIKLIKLIGLMVMIMFLFVHIAHFNRRIKVSFPADVRRTQIEDIAQLAPGQEVRLPLEIVLSGLAGTMPHTCFFCLSFCSPRLAVV